MIAFGFPGQGTQRQNMYETLAEYEKETDYIFEAASDAFGKDVKKMCIEATEEKLTDTLNTQITVSAMDLAFAFVAEKYGAKADVVTGHSLGQYPALIYARALTLFDGFRLIEKRARLMSGVQKKGVLCAVLGLDFDAVNNLCDGTSVSVALYNAPNQIVIGGEKDAVCTVSERAEKEGAIKTQLLKVDNAFHTPIMAEMEEEFSSFVESASFSEPTCPILLNCLGKERKDAESIKRDIVAQCCHTVRWSDLMAKIAADKNLLFVETGMGNVLSGLIKKHNRKCNTFCMSDRDARNAFFMRASY